MLKRSLFATLSLLAFSAVAALFLLFYRSELGRNVAWHETVQIDRESRLTLTVFELARKSGFLKTLKGPKGELFIEAPPCEHLLLKRTQANRELRTALTVLCTSPQGEEVRQEVDSWNASYDLVAVRDNKSQNEQCETEPLTAEIFVPRDCKKNAWQAERLLQGRAVSVNWIPRAEPPPDEFHPLVDPDEPTVYAGDWAMLRSDQAAATQRPRYRLSSTIEVPPGREVIVDVAGRLRRVQIGSADSAGFTVNPARPETPGGGVRLGNARVNVFLFCGPIPDVLEDTEDVEEKNVDECVMEPDPNLRSAVAYQVRISVDGGAAKGKTKGKKRATAEGRTVQVYLEVEPVENLPRSLRKRSEQFAVARTLHFRATCTEAFHTSGAGCDLAWTRVPGSERRGPREYKVVLQGSNDDNLVNPTTGIIRPEAFQAGLAPIVGFGPQDFGSLVSSLARKRVPRNPDGTPVALPPVELTIDQRIQRAAQAIVNSTRDCQSRRALATRGKGLPPCIRIRNDQTATLVVLDAGDRAGEIRAIATWPPLPRHLHIWDLQALESVESGIGGLGWRLISGTQRPGSVFKLITGLAGMASAAATGSAQMAALLSGRMNVQQQTSYLRLARTTNRVSIACAIGGGPPNTIPVPDARRPRWCARNFGWGDFFRASAPSATGCPSGGKGSQFGMCEALMVSSNLFFGGLSWRLTDRSLNPPAPSLTLAQTAHRLTFGDTTSQSTAKFPLQIPSFDLTRGMAGNATKLRADAIRFDFRDHNGALKNLPNLIRAGFGDGEGATPLAIATAYASVARGRIVRPSIVPLERDGEGCPVNRADLECDTLVPGFERVAQLFAHVRGGLHAVASAPGGTARFFANSRSLLKMPDGRPRLFVKTGTATTNTRPLLFSLWLAGWIEGVESTGIKQRLAFACMITRGRNNDSGGGTCGRLVLAFLTELNR